MHALSVPDLAMFLLETPQRPYNVGTLIVLDPPERSRGSFADELFARMLERPAGPPFNYRLPTPLLGVPTLEEVDHFDLATPVHRVTLNEPGTLQQLFDRVCTIHQKQLDRSRPIWQFYVIDGLEGGRVALYGKIHHGLIDGRTFVQVISTWLATSPHETPVRAMWEGVPRRARAGAAQASAIDRMRQALGQAAATAVTAASLCRMLVEQALCTLGVGSDNTLMFPFTGIPEALKGPSSTKRSFAYCSLPLAEMKSLRKAHGAKLNDLILVTLDIGLERYLRHLGIRPDKPLVTAMPVALTGASGGNQIAILQFPLGEPGRSAAERLEQIQRHTATVKDVVERESSDTVMLLTTLVHGIPALLEQLGMDGGISISNFIVSNPFGLMEKRFLMGAEVELALPVSVVNAGQMLNVTAVTLDDRLQLGFLAIPGGVPKVHELARFTRDAFDELKDALSEAHHRQ